MNLSFFDRAVRLVLGLVAFVFAWTLFEHPLAKIIVVAFGVLAIVESITGICWLYHRLGVHSRKDRIRTESLYLFGLGLAQAVVAYEWWSAGWEKVSSPAFVEGIGNTLRFFASKNPFPWYKNFIEGFALQNATLFAYAVEWSQILIALALFVAAVLIIYAKRTRTTQAVLIVACLALFGGLLMNANFYFAAGWTGPGAKGSNVVMFWVQGVLLFVWLSVLINKISPKAK
ncbi:MAG: DUF2892 domain-containing protein [bacterium]|nr:DUF2892 domain-containing protein [bacterium]